MNIKKNIILKSLNQEKNHLKMKNQNEFQEQNHLKNHQDISKIPDFRFQLNIP